MMEAISFNGFAPVPSSSPLWLFPLEEKTLWFDIRIDAFDGDLW